MEIETKVDPGPEKLGFCVRVCVCDSQRTVIGMTEEGDHVAGSNSELDNRVNFLLPRR